MKYFVMTYDEINQENTFYQKDKRTGQFMFGSELFEECIPAILYKKSSFMLTKLNEHECNIKCFTVPCFIGWIICFFRFLRRMIFRFLMGDL